VVLVVLGLSAAIAFPKLDGLLLREPEPWRSGRRLMRLAEYTHQMAIATESVFILHIDAEAGRYWVTGEQIGDVARKSMEGQLPEEVTIADVGLPGDDRTVQHVVALEFSPEGWCDPAIVTITSSDGRIVKVVIGEWFGAIDITGDRPAG
jgi:hypothetical protein